MSISFLVVSVVLARMVPGVALWARAIGARSLAEAGVLPERRVAPATGSFWSGIDGSYRLPVLIAYLALVIATTLWPAEKNLGELIALSAALLVASQFWYLDKGGTLVLLYLPLILLMMFRPTLTAKRRPAPPTARSRNTTTGLPGTLKRAHFSDPAPNHPEPSRMDHGLSLTYETIAQRIDHSLLMPTLTEPELAEGCRLAARYRVASVCIKPYGVALAASILKGTDVAVGTTIGFPHGGHLTSVKVYESERAIDDGATELDMVINIGQAIGGQWDAVQSDIAAVTRVAHARGAIVKVIFENCYLNDVGKIQLCSICGEVGADYVKTSTGYGTGGSTEADLVLMRKQSPPGVKLKAAGGIRTLDAAIECVRLGCDRIGASKTAEMLDELTARLKG